MRKSTPALIFTVAIATATIFSCQKNKNITTIDSPGTEVLEMPAVPYEYFGFSGGQKANQMAALGRVLFYDKHLSINNTVSCASCHKQAFAFADNVAFSRGFENKLTGRNSMPLENLPGQFGFGGPINLFWDGRSTSLEDLILRPVNNHVEMGISDLSTLPGKLSGLSYYADLFETAYGDNEITLERISESMASFVESITANQSKFDLAQMDEVTLSGQEQYGLSLFDSKYNCRSCHTLAPTIYYGGLGSATFVNIGLDAVAKDRGAGAVSGNTADDGKFRIPNLHNIAITGPYMHDGRFTTLEQVIDHYSHGINTSPSLDPRLRDVNGNAMRMNISADEKAALIAFLNTLTDTKMITDPKFSNPFKIR